jgi:RNA polymerase sigma-70 factor (ECF subfamily)
MAPLKQAPPTEITATSGVKVVVRPTPPPAPVKRREPPPVERTPRVVVQPPPNPNAERDAAVARICQQDGVFLLALLAKARLQPASAEDLLQEMLIVLTKFIDECGVPPPKGRVYLIEVARRLVHNHRRRFRAPVDPEADADAAVDSAPDPEALLRMAQDRVDLAAAIDSLSELYEPVMRLVVLDGDTLDQAAEKLGLARGTVSTRLTRGRALVREILNKGGEGR